MNVSEHDCEKWDADCPSCHQEKAYWGRLYEARAEHCTDCIREARGVAAAGMCEGCDPADHRPCEWHKQ